MNNGTCIDSHVNKSYFPGYQCQCTVDYTGKQCEKLIDLCNEYPCKNNATCERLAYNEYGCTCTEGFGNVNCSGLLANCLPNSCNSGVCIPLMDSYVCQCNRSYTGRNCDSLINKCDSNPNNCNKGTCIDGIDSFTCSCTSGFTGKFCDSDIDECVGEIIWTLRFEDATAAKTSLKKCTCVLSVFIAIIPIHIFVKCR